MSTEPQQRSRPIYRLFIIALVNCTRLPGDLAWRVVALLFERAMRDREED